MGKDFGLGKGFEIKHWVSIGHWPDGHLFVFKTTASRVEWYRSQGAPRMAGLVCYNAGELPCFARDTIVERDNAFSISYEEIRERQRDRTFEIKQELPADFPAVLKNRIDNSITLDGPQREAIDAALARPTGTRPPR